jgi:hypothetical protein
MFTAYQFNPEYLADKRAELTLATKAKGGLLKTAPASLAMRLNADHMRYLEFGPYWFALKAIATPSLGSYDEPLIRQAYTQADDELTFVAAFEFADDYRQGMMAGTRHFALQSEPKEGDQPWILFDPDMESK